MLGRATRRLLGRHQPSRAPLPGLSTAAAAAALPLLDNSGGIKLVVRLCDVDVKEPHAIYRSALRTSMAMQGPTVEAACAGYGADKGEVIRHFQRKSKARPSLERMAHLRMAHLERMAIICHGCPASNLEFHAPELSSFTTAGAAALSNRVIYSRPTHPRAPLSGFTTLLARSSRP